MKTIEKITTFINTKLTLFVILVIVIALLFPQLFIPLSNVKVFSFSLTNILLALVMFGTGMSMTFEQIKEIFQNPRNVLAGLVCKYLIISLAAFATAKFLHLNDQLAFGMILLCCVPPGTASAVVVLLAGGDVAFSVAITVLSTLVSPIITPFLTFIFGGSWVDINFVDMFFNIFITVLIPILAGMLVQYIGGQQCENVKKVFRLLSVFAIIVIVAICTAPNKSAILSIQSILIIFAVIFITLIAAGGNALFARFLKLDREKTNALIITCSEQNSALAVGIAADFANVLPMASIPPIIAVSVNVTLVTIIGSFLGRNNSQKAASSSVTP